MQQKQYKHVKVLGLLQLKENFTSNDPTKDDLPKNMWVSELQNITDKEAASFASSQVRYLP